MVKYCGVILLFVLSCLVSLDIYQRSHLSRVARTPVQQVIVEQIVAPVFDAQIDKLMKGCRVWEAVHGKSIPGDADDCPQLVAHELITRINWEK